MSAAAIVHPRLTHASFERAIRPLLTGGEAFEKLGITLLDFSFPYLDVALDWRTRSTSIRLRVDGTDFSYRPVSGWWIDEQGAALVAGNGKVPSGNGFSPGRVDGRPGCWFCFKGWREYHDHSSHQDLSWASLRDDKLYAVLQLILQLHKDLNQPGLGVA